MPIQWRIQDFCEEGAPTSQGGAPTYDYAKIFQKLHEIERIWTGGASLAPPLDPPLQSDPWILKGFYWDKSITSRDADSAGQSFTQTLFTMFFSANRNCTNAFENTDDSLIAKLNLLIISYNEPIP